VGENTPAVRTAQKSTVSENIGKIYGALVAKSLLPVEFTDDHLKFSVQGYITNAKYSQKKGTFLLFINHRSVHSANIKKAIEEVYSTYLAKGDAPFVYLGLEMDPHILDVNVHPTKHEVNFLHEENIVDRIVKEIEKTLLGNNETRVFYTQSRLPGAPSPSNMKEDDPDKTIYAKDLVRTDPKIQKLDVFLVQAPKEGDQNSSTLNKTLPKNKKDTFRK
jgi:DNA mismatch repair protein MLH1